MGSTSARVPPPQGSGQYWLQVHKPRREKHVNLGDSVVISCELRESVSEPEAVFWYHNHSMVAWW